MDINSIASMSKKKKGSFALLDNPSHAKSLSTPLYVYIYIYFMRNIIGKNLSKGAGRVFVLVFFSFFIKLVAVLLWPSLKQTFDTFGTLPLNTVYMIYYNVIRVFATNRIFSGQIPTKNCTFPIAHYVHRIHYMI